MLEAVGMKLASKLVTFERVSILEINVPSRPGSACHLTISGGEVKSSVRLAISTASGENRNGGSDNTVPMNGLFHLSVKAGASNCTNSRLFVRLFTFRADRSFPACPRDGHIGPGGSS